MAFGLILIMALLTGCSSCSPAVLPVIDEVPIGGTDNMQIRPVGIMIELRCDE